eukprot:TRINITY_DN81572_c0_g1_i1.p1 TRINITY_DN81572_c0_g1~~TRINITY_DN81572_c0_g1_i1.p1  ORF type:complete len:173 (+),score=54.93 TRINITY_DN81572_c0_g1_i1:111-629(+)
MAYQANGGGRDYFIVADETRVRGKHEPGVNELYRNPFESRLFKEETKLGSSVAACLRPDVGSSEKVPAKPKISGFGGYKPSSADVIGKSYTRAAVDPPSPPAERTSLRRVDRAVPQSSSRFQTTTRFELDVVQKGVEDEPVGKDSDPFRHPVPGYSGHRPRTVRWFVDEGEG